MPLFRRSYRCADFQITQGEIQETDVDYDKEMMMYI